MTAVGPGLTLPQLAKDSLLRRRETKYKSPRAAATNGAVTTVDPSTFVVGTALTLTTLGSSFLRRARRVTVTINDDDAGGGLSVTVKVTGCRWGQPVSEVLTATSTDTNDTSVTSVNCYDQLLSIIPLAVTADSGDDFIAGFDGTSFGLEYPIDNIVDVYSIINVSTVTEAAAVAPSSTTVVAGAPTGGVVAGGSYVKGITLATSDDWSVQYLTSLKTDGVGTQGDIR